MTKRQLMTFILLLFILPGCKADKAQHDKSAVKLETVQVKTKTVALVDVPVLTEVMGTVTAARQATIAAKIMGAIAKLPVVLGSRVNKGDLLVQIKAEEIDAKVAQAKARLAQTRRTLEKERKLLAKKAATSEGVKNLEDQYQVAKAGYREATTMLGYTEIRAPFSGLITRKMAEVGDLATPGVPLLEIETYDRFQVVAGVPEGVLLKVQVGDELPVNIPSVQMNGTGKVTQIAPAIDPQSRTATIKIDLAHDSRLRSGQFVRVVLPGASGTTSFVPATAVRRFGQMEKVFVVRNGQAQLRLVRVGSHKGDQLEILAGLEAGDQVIINNAALLDGQPVTTLP